ncbi:MAG: purine-nucleoside phosphorylase [Gemmataceae bacterium]
MTDFPDFQRACVDHPPATFLVLGSGLGVIAERLRPLARVRFADIPGLPASTIVGHRGQWTLGLWESQCVLMSEGRLHYYEGHPWEVVVRPIQVAASLGVRRVLLTNAAGGIRDDLDPGSLMPIRDHLQWNQPHPWRVTPTSSPYSEELLEVIRQVGGAKLPGIYAAVTGPSYETPAEIRALRSVGADAVGMSTSREAMAARAAGLQVAAISMVTNRAAGLSAGKLDHQEVLAEGKASAARLGNLLEGILQRAGDSKNSR